MHRPAPASRRSSPTSSAISAGAGDRPGAQLHQHPADAAAGAGARAIGGGHAERGQPPLQLRDLLGARPLLRRIGRRRAVRADQRVVDVEGGHQLDARRHLAERVAQPGAAVGRGRAADADHHPARSGVDRGADQLAGAVRPRAQRIQRDAGQPPQAAGLGDVQRGAAVGEHREPGVARPAERVVDRGGVPAAATGGQQRRRGALAAVGHRHQHQVVAGTHAAPPGGQGLCRLRRRVRPLELVGGDHDPHQRLSLRPGRGRPRAMPSPSTTRRSAGRGGSRAARRIPRSPRR